MSETTSLNLYSGQPQHANFSRMKELFPVGTLEPARSPHPFPVGRSIELPDSVLRTLAFGALMPQPSDLQSSPLPGGMARRSTHT